MEIIISANHTVLDFVRNKSNELSENMTEEEYYKWLSGTERNSDHEERLQEVTV